jgi:hypothetical protein
MPEGRRFVPGKSGNPGGRPKEWTEFKQQCRDHSPLALQTLLESLKDEEGNVRNKAAEILLAYAWGKPTQAVEMSGPEGSPVSISINRTVKK